MGEVNLLGEAVKFMFMGMGVVFTFLGVMIFALKLQAYLIDKFLKVETKVETKEWKPEPIDDKQITAAITAAIIHHNNIKG
ncbi:MAG: OadG family protein [Epsilonproteobacteria bacterium]|nr:OadG family protein [Campylobacterota bacterium]